jgi:hypothetical protein
VPSEELELEATELCELELSPSSELELPSKELELSPSSEPELPAKELELPAKELELPLPAKELELPPPAKELELAAPVLEELGLAAGLGGGSLLLSSLQATKTEKKPINTRKAVKNLRFFIKSPIS